MIHFEILFRDLLNI